MGTHVFGLGLAGSTPRLQICNLLSFIDTDSKLYQQKNYLFTKVHKHGAKL